MVVLAARARARSRLLDPSVAWKPGRAGAAGVCAMQRRANARRAARYANHVRDCGSRRDLRLRADPARDNSVPARQQCARLAARRCARVANTQSRKHSRRMRASLRPTREQSQRLPGRHGRRQAADRWQRGIDPQRTCAERRPELQRSRSSEGFIGRRVKNLYGAAVAGQKRTRGPAEASPRVARSRKTPS